MLILNGKVIPSSQTLTENQRKFAVETKNVLPHKGVPGFSIEARANINTKVN
jgi:hypothetical protein